jgi:hypothetical protein
MKKLISLTLVIFSALIKLFAQDDIPKGRPVLEIFTDFHYELGKDTSKSNGFSLNRAYFGYNYTLDKNFVTSVILDIGSPLDLGTGSKSRRYAHFREASVGYVGEKFTLTMGITGTRIFSYQQKFWGKRYIANTYQSINGYGFVADLGVVADYKINDWLQTDVTLMNGKGYSSIQLDKTLKASIGFTITPTSRISVRLFSDLMKNMGLWQSTMVAFVGFRNDLFFIGGEGSFKSNLDLKDGHHAWGLSSTGGINVAKNTELFARCDFITSVVPDGEPIEWNYQRDGIFAVGGVQYTINKYIKAAIDYQSFFPYDEAQSITDYMYLNVLVKF